MRVSHIASSRLVAAAKRVQHLCIGFRPKSASSLPFFEMAKLEVMPRRLQSLQMHASQFVTWPHVARTWPAATTLHTLVLDVPCEWCDRPARIPLPTCMLVSPHAEMRLRRRIQGSFAAAPPAGASRPDHLRLQRHERDRPGRHRRCHRAAPSGPGQVSAAASAVHAPLAALAAVLHGGALPRLRRNAVSVFFLLTVPDARRDSAPKSRRPESCRLTVMHICILAPFPARATARSADRSVCCDLQCFVCRGAAKSACAAQRALPARRLPTSVPVLTARAIPRSVLLHRASQLKGSDGPDLVRSCRA